MTGPAGVMALLLAETAAGGAAFLFLTPLWKEVRPGFFYLTGTVVLVLAGSAAASANAGYDPSVAPEGRTAVLLALALAASTLAWLICLAFRFRPVARALGVATVGVAGVMLVAFARATEESFALSLMQLLAGALFTGAVLDGLLLGHWYLTDRKLTRRPINRAAWLLVAAVAVEVVAVAVGAGFETGPGPRAGESFNPLLFLAGSATWIAVGMVVCTGLIAVFIRLTLRGTRPAAVQSATGFFYLAVITAFMAELAAKVSFLP